MHKDAAAKWAYPEYLRICRIYERLMAGRRSIYEAWDFQLPIVNISREKPRTKQYMLQARLILNIAAIVAPVQPSPVGPDMSRSLTRPVVPVHYQHYCWYPEALLAKWLLRIIMYKP
jgi:hypothetical protein